LFVDLVDHLPQKEMSLILSPRQVGKRLIPVEVKYKHLKQDKVPASLRSFIAKYNPEQAYIINLDLSKTLKLNRTALFFLPFHELPRQTTVL